MESFHVPNWYGGWYNCEPTVTRTTLHFYHSLVIWFIVNLHFGNTIQDKRRLEIFVFLSLTWHVTINDKIKWWGQHIPSLQFHVPRQVNKVPPLQFHDRSTHSSFAVPWQVNKFLLYSSMTSKHIPPLQFLGCSTHSLSCSSLAAQHIPSLVVPYFIVRDGAFSLLLTTWPPGKAPPDMGIILLNISWSPQLFQSPTPQMAVTTSPSHVTSHCKPTEINPIIVICWSSSQNTDQWLGVSRQV